MYNIFDYLIGLEEDYTFHVLIGEMVRSKSFFKLGMISVTEDGQMSEDYRGLKGHTKVVEKRHFKGKFFSLFQKRQKWMLKNTPLLTLKAYC